MDWTLGKGKLKGKLRLLATLASSFVAGQAFAANPAIISVESSSTDGALGAELAWDHDPHTAWCAAKKAPGARKFVQAGETFEDWWEAELQPGVDTVSAIRMRSGWVDKDVLRGYKIRDFAWAYQKRGDSSWYRIPETDLYANRYQLIFRFDPITNIKKLRLMIRPRDPDELAFRSSNAPCLREIDLYESRDAKIPVAPWFLRVATWEEGNIFDQLRHWGEPFDARMAVNEALLEASANPNIIQPDTVDELWVAEFNPKHPKSVATFADPTYSNWIFHEPAPAGILLSGNYRNYDRVDSSLYEGFYSFLNENAKTAGSKPLLGSCGGHQLLAMALEHPTYQRFQTEFSRDHLGQVVVTCSSNPRYGCGNTPAVQCCYEGGEPDPIRYLGINTPDRAMANPYASSRHDFLLNMLPGGAERGFQALLFHTDYVAPEKIADQFDVIATYPKGVSGLDREHPALVQAMKLKEKPIYGTQFHWDMNHPEKCKRTEADLNMERVLKNFIFLSLNELNDPTSFDLYSASTRDADHRPLFDLDRNTLWCAAPTADGKASLTIAFHEPKTIQAALTIRGETSDQARRQELAFQYSLDGKRWFNANSDQITAFEAQRERAYTCSREKDLLPGIEDGQTFLNRMNLPVEGKYFRVQVQGEPGRPVCLRELMLLKGSRSNG